MKNVVNKVHVHVLNACRYSKHDKHVTSYQPINGN